MRSFGYRQIAALKALGVGNSSRQGAKSPTLEEKDRNLANAARRLEESRSGA
jgi:hypothetical protein